MKAKIPAITTSQGCKWLEILATQTNIPGQGTVRAGQNFNVVSSFN